MKTVMIPIIEADAKNILCMLEDAIPKFDDEELAWVLAELNHLFAECTRERDERKDAD
jgi:hypothetical protein